MIEIKYQTLLNNNPVIPSKHSNYVFKLEPLSIDKIVSLETTYNQNNKFPASLRELLYLAGNSCYVLDYGGLDSQTAIQENSREMLIDRNIQHNRPFFVIDVYDYGQQFLFVYLDEGVDDPNVHQMEFSSNVSSELGLGLTEYINLGIKKLLSGRNPF